MRLPPLNTLRFFEAAARHGSLSKAAVELCVTQSAVSRQIIQLEQAVGMPLFERRNRSIFLTSEGRKLFITCSEVFQALQDTVSSMGVRDMAEPLVVSCEPTIMMRWLIPRLSDFHQQSPEIQIHLFAAGGPIDFSQGHVDLALRRDDFSWPETLYTSRMGQELVGPVLKSEEEDKWKTSKPLHVLHTRTRPEAWHQWVSKTGNVMNASKETWFEHFYIMLEAVEAGMGVGLTSLYMVERDLQSGQLSAPEGFIADQSTYHLLSSEPFESDPRKKIFMSWLTTQFSITEKLALKWKI
jgi:DNA-binding transcriptional LysR family regulator